MSISLSLFRRYRTGALIIIMRVNPPFYRQVSGSLISRAQCASVLIYIKLQRTHPLPTHADQEISLGDVTLIFLMIIKRKHTRVFF